MPAKTLSIVAALVAVTLVAMYGIVQFGLIRWKGWESFESATTVQGATRTLPGDPGASGGIATASGGRITVTRYGEGARKSAPEPLVPSYDQPAKGSGQQPGEGTIEAAPGYGHANGPAFQNAPGAVSSTSTRSKE